jgi:hypothetical protein
LEAAKPRIFIAWHRYNYLCAQALRHWPEHYRPTLIMHDGLASRALTHESSVWMGFNTFVFLRQSEVPPRQQIIEYIKISGDSILLLPDSGGPYKEVKPGVVEIATACQATVWPLTVYSQGAFPLGRTLRHYLPTPWCRLVVRLGAPIPPREVTLPRCQAALDALEEHRAGYTI